jgi:hypothetical protein
MEQLSPEGRTAEITSTLEAKVRAGQAVERLETVCVRKGWTPFTFEASGSVLHDRASVGEPISLTVSPISQRGEHHRWPIGDCPRHHRKDAKVGHPRPT